MLAILLSSRIGRGLLLCLFLALVCGAAWWHFSALYEARGYAKRTAEDAAQTAKLQSALDMAGAKTAQSADALATAQINNAALLGSFQNAISPTAPKPSAIELRSLNELWAKAAGIKP